MEPGLPRIWADERAVRQVALNLLSNAIKFTPQGGSITIKVGWTRKGGQYLSIADTGPGIPPEEIPIVLSSFGRGTLAQKNAEEGTGLGLPIVKGLVELHGGEFRLNSTLRLGTEVIVIFPPERVMDTLPALNAELIPEAPERRRRRMRRRQRDHARLTRRAGRQDETQSSQSALGTAPHATRISRKLRLRTLPLALRGSAPSRRRNVSGTL